MQCGGSDGYSGITANPALGVGVDLLVQHGGTAILSETPEIYGPEQLLTRRAISREVGEKIIERIHWWVDCAEREKGSIDNNPTPGNKTGGLTTILEKSLGAVAKSGSTPLTGVYRYAEPVDTHGLVFMGCARLRSDGGHRSDRERRKSRGLHHWPRFVFRCQTRSVDQARHQYRHVQSHARRYGHQLRRHHGRHRDVQQKGEEIFRAILWLASGKKAAARHWVSATMSSCRG